MLEQTNTVHGPHKGQPIRTAGEPIASARAAVLMLHGRGASAVDILSLAGELEHPGFAYIAPEAAENAWYPNRFFVPVEHNEPWLSSALSFVGDVFSQIVDAGIPPERVILLGFSQGACLALEFAARNAQRYGGVVGLSGGLIGSDDTPRDYKGSLEHTPVFLGCSDVDVHIPKERVQHAAGILRDLGGNVTERLYPNMGHSVNHDEIKFVRGMQQLLVSAE